MESFTMTFKIITSTATVWDCIPFHLRVHQLELLHGLTCWEHLGSTHILNGTVLSFIFKMDLDFSLLAIVLSPDRLLIDYFICNCKDVLLEMKTRIIHAMVFPITMPESETVKKVDEKLKLRGARGEVWGYSGLSEKWTSRSQIKSSMNYVWKQKMLKQRLSWVGHILRRQNALEETIMLGKAQGSRKRGRPNVTWIDFL